MKLKPTLALAGIFLLTGLVLVLIPFHVQMTGFVFLLLGAAALLQLWLSRKNTPAAELLRNVIICAACVGVIGLTACMGLVCDGTFSDLDSDSEPAYGILLGSAVRGDGNPSLIMRSRMQAAVELCSRYPDMPLVLSGAQGDDEPISEAECMYRELVKLGIPESRLIIEDESHSTRENLQNSIALMNDRGTEAHPVVIITSDFHLRRSLYLADHFDMHAMAASAKTPQWFLRVNYIVREVFAFVKASVLNSIE